jgi:lysophospholipase L1-like esterase
MVLGTAVVLVLLLLGAEAAVRVRQHLKYGSVATLEEQFTVDSMLNLRVPVAGFSRGHVSVNSLGFRGPEIAVPKPTGTVRLAFLGASTTWCAEVSSNEQVWTHLVTEELSRAFPAVRFDYINAGVPGYTLESILTNYVHRVAPLQPDVVVIYEAANNLSGEMRHLAARRGIISTEKLEFGSWPGRYSLLWNLVEKNLKVLAAQRIARSENQRLEVDPRTLGAGYKEALTRVVRAAQQQARLVAVATFSVQPRRDQSPQRQMQASSSALFYMPFLHPETIIGAYERYNEIVREVAKETGALLIDGENDIPGDPVNFNDSVHVTDMGSKAMADRIARALKTSPRLKELLTIEVAPVL